MFHFTEDIHDFTPRSGKQCLRLVCFFQATTRLNAKRPRPSEGPYFYYSVFVWIPLLHVWTEMDFAPFLCFFNGSWGEWYRPNLLACVSATRVPHQGKQHRDPLKGRRWWLNEILDLSWCSCRCQRHWGYGALSPPTNALPDEKENSLFEWLQAWLFALKLDFPLRAAAFSRTPPKLIWYGKALVRNFP